jgi:hypothetical protein
MRAPELQDEVVASAQSGVGLEQIEHTLIHPSGLSEDEKAALWLLAWCHTTQNRAGPTRASVGRVLTRV